MQDDNYDAKAPAANGMPAWHRWLVGILSFAMLALNIWVTYNYDLDASQVRALFLALTFILIFLLYPWSRGRTRKSWQLAVDAVMAGAGLFVTFYIVIGFEAVFDRAGAESTLDLLVAGAATFLVLETTRRSTGLALPIMALVFLLYPALFGPYMPGFFRTGAFSIERVLASQYLSLEGILGAAFKVSIEFIFLFVMFGAFLNRLGVTEFFIDLSRAVSGNSRGASAKMSVISSGLMGSISGSAVANVVTTGVVTIPLMRREGYRPAMAGAVEAAASTGGQLMPPVMGAAAFLMAEFTRIPYSQIILYALVPAIFYYISIWFAVHWEAIRSNLKGLNDTGPLPRIGLIMRERGLSIVPLLLVTVMLMMGDSLADSVLYGTLSAIAVAAIMPVTRAKVTVPNMVGAVRDGVEGSLSLLASSACAGMIIGIVTMTGLGLKISTLMIDASGGIAWIALSLAAITCIIFGMGLPTQIIYLTLAVLVAPAIVKMGITVAGAHLFIMYFGMMSMVTPPVCFAAFAAASLSGARMMETGWLACKLALAGLILPFYFAFHPGVMLIGGPLAIGEGLLRTAIGLYAAGVGAGMFFFSEAAARTSVTGPMVWLRRALALAATVVLIVPGLPALGWGLGLFVVCYAMEPVLRRFGARAAAGGE